MSFTWYEGGIRIPSPLREVRPTDVSSRVTSREGSGAQRERAQQAYGRASEEPHRGEKALLAHQIMSAPVMTLTADATLTEAWNLVRTHRFRHVPVISEEGFVVGILSDRDLMATSGGIAEEAANLANGANVGQTVSGLMASCVLTTHPATPIRQIARVMYDERIGAMPIVDDDARLQGIITRSDILRALIQHAPLEMWI